MDIVKDGCKHKLLKMINFITYMHQKFFFIGVGFFYFLCLCFEIYWWCYCQGNIFAHGSSYDTYYQTWCDTYISVYIIFF